MSRRWTVTEAAEELGGDAADVWDAVAAGVPPAEIGEDSRWTLTPAEGSP